MPDTKELGQIVKTSFENGEVRISFHPPLKLTNGDEIEAMQVTMLGGDTPLDPVQEWYDDMSAVDNVAYVGAPTIERTAVEYLAPDALDAYYRIQRYYTKGIGRVPRRDEMLLVINMLALLAEEYRQSEQRLLDACFPSQESNKSRPHR